MFLNGSPCMEKVQRRFTRCCFGLPRRHIHINNKDNIEYSERCTRLGLPLLMNRLEFLSISFAAKCLCRKFDIPILNYLALNTRHLNTVKFWHLQSRTNAFYQSLFVRFPRIWDSLVLNTRNSILYDITPFLTNLRKHYHI